MSFYPAAMAAGDPGTTKILQTLIWNVRCKGFGQNAPFDNFES